MVAGLVYAVRLVAAVIVVGLGLILFVASAASGKTKPRELIIATVIAAGGALAWPRRPNAWRRDPPTDRQIAYARDLGVVIPRGATKGTLSDLIDQAKQDR